MVKKISGRIYLTIIFLFLYLPILVLIVLSFNNSKSRVIWGGFTGKWYVSMFQNETIMEAFITTLQITLTASVLATIIDAPQGKSDSLGRNKHSSAQCGYCYWYFHDAFICTFHKAGLFYRINRPPDFRHSLCHFKCTSKAESNQQICL